MDNKTLEDIKDIINADSVLSLCNVVGGVICYFALKETYNENRLYVEIGTRFLGIGGIIAYYFRDEIKEFFS